MRRINIVVGSAPVGSGPTWAYPAGEKLGLFSIPVYRMSVYGKDDKGKFASMGFNVFRFGVQSKDGKTAHVVGLADAQTHTIKMWDSTYSTRSSDSPEKGAWIVYDDFLIHDGPDHEFDGPFATIGCIEVHGRKGFDRFNDFVISVSGAPGPARAQKLQQIGYSGQMVITYEKAQRPPLTRWKKWS